MRALIIEDEPLIAKNLKTLLRELLPECSVEGPVDSVETAVNYLRNQPLPDLLFCDIQLSDGISFDIFQQVPVQKPVIFVTAYNEYAVRAFRVNSIDYLLKPIDKQALTQALEKFKRLHATPNPDFSLQNLSELFSKPPVKLYKERFLVHARNGWLPVPQKDVICFSKNSVIYLHTSTEKLITDYQTIDELEELVDPAIFFRANRQTLVHIDGIESYSKHSSLKLEVRLKNGMLTDVSREKAQDFRHWLEH
ncbi:MAG: LytTR family DNA-binding domain-containing protein [Chitinophagales bacterium]